MYTIKQDFFPLQIIFFSPHELRFFLQVSDLKKPPTTNCYLCNELQLKQNSFGICGQQTQNLNFNRLTDFQLRSGEFYSASKLRPFHVKIPSVFKSKTFFFRNDKKHASLQGRVANYLSSLQGSYHYPTRTQSFFKEFSRESFSQKGLVVEGFELGSLW